MRMSHVGPEVLVQTDQCELAASGQSRWVADLRGALSRAEAFAEVVAPIDHDGIVRTIKALFADGHQVVVFALRTSGAIRLIASPVAQRPRPLFPAPEAPTLPRSDLFAALRPPPRRITPARIDSFFRSASLLLPQRLADEELGDALEDIHRRFDRGEAGWRLVVKAVTSVAWTAFHAVRFGWRRLGARDRRGA